MNIFEEASNLDREQEEEFVLLAFNRLREDLQTGPGIRMRARPLRAPGDLPAIDLRGRQPAHLLEWLIRSPDQALLLPEVRLLSPAEETGDIRMEYNNGQIV